MIGFIIGTFVGSAVGVTAMCLCRVASEADEHLGQEKKRY
ncbi:MAG: DUF3789 domain-containing protein [Ruminococcus sp.]|nr:DUF3789 domain-containing protein [Ruminococcus sp.]